jgi:RNA polymerase sigma factor (sigma-70 family)
MIPSDLTVVHFDLARKLARTAKLRLSPNLRFRLSDDIESDAMFGLVKASIAYVEKRGPFPPYAIIRIRGEIGDGMRRVGLSRYASRRTRELPAIIVFTGTDDLSPLDYGNPDPLDEADTATAVRQAIGELDEWSKQLQPLQRQIYDLLRAGVSQRKISEQLHIGNRRVSNIEKGIHGRALSETDVEWPW